MINEILSNRYGGDAAVTNRIVKPQDAALRPRREGGEVAAHWCAELGDLTTFFEDCGYDEVRVADVLAELIDASLATLGTDDCGMDDIESHDAMTFLINLRERVLSLKMAHCAELADLLDDRMDGEGGQADGASPRAAAQE